MKPMHRLGKIAKWIGKLILLLLIILIAIISYHYLYRPGLPQYRDFLANDTPPAKTTTGVNVRWFGVTAIVIEDANTRLFIDPFFSRPEGWIPLLANQSISPNQALIQQWLTAHGLNNIDAVLVSHSHFDHAMDAPSVARFTEAALYGSSSTIQLGLTESMPAEQLVVIAPDQAYTVGDFRIRFIPSKHAGFTGGRPTGDIEAPLTPPYHYLDYKQGGSYSILIEHPSGNILHHGSAGYIEGALADVQADLVLLGIAIRPSLTDYYQHTVNAVGATRVIPTHWDDFTIALPINTEALPTPMPFGVTLDDYLLSAPRNNTSGEPIEQITLKIGQTYPAY